MQNISFKTKRARMFSSGLMSIAFMMLFTFLVNGNLVAQSGVTKSNEINPKSEEAAIASQLGVTIAPFNSWNKQSVAKVVKQRLAAINPATNNVQELFKLVYYTSILEDMRYSVSPEISTVKRLVTAGEKMRSTEITRQFVLNLYNDLISSF